jgi:hypothetical protein
MAPASKTAYDAAVARVENATAIANSGHDSLLELWLFLRALERRGIICEGDARAAQADLERVKSAIDLLRGMLAEQRAAPLGDGS